MIREDYLLRMIEQLGQLLRQIMDYERTGQCEAADATLDEAFRELIKLDAAAVEKLTPDELQAKLLREDATYVIRTKCFILVALLAQAANLRATQDQSIASLACRLKALHLLLDVLGRDDDQLLPEFVPKVEDLASQLDEQGIPRETHAALMQHYERTGQYSKAEDRLYAIREADPGNLAIAPWGVAFYERMQTLSDAALAEGGLPRDEVEAGLIQWCAWNSPANPDTSSGNG